MSNPSSTQQFQFDKDSLSEKVEVPLLACIYMKNIIDTCASRGTFLSDEFEALGEVVKHLKNALTQAINKQQQRLSSRQPQRPRQPSLPLTSSSTNTNVNHSGDINLLQSTQSTQSTQSMENNDAQIKKV